jgi:hypothetical protein
MKPFRSRKLTAIELLRQELAYQRTQRRRQRTLYLRELEALVLELRPAPEPLLRDRRPHE